MNLIANALQLADYIKSYASHGPWQIWLVVKSQLSPMFNAHTRYEKDQSYE
jgi:hypothetical protein